MSQQFFLTSLLQRRSKEAAALTRFDQFIGNILDDTSPEKGLVEQLIMFPDMHKRCTPWHLVERWQETLAILIFLRQRGLLSVYQRLLLERVCLLNSHFLWAEFQLIATYRALCARLLDRNPQEPPIHQLSSGACPLEWGGRWSWGGVPHMGFHAELGILWCLYGQLSQADHYVRAAERLAEWQLNTLDYDYHPCVGLFSQEGDATQSRLLISNYLLFHAVAKLTGRSDLAFAAEKQRDILNQLMAETPFSIPYIAVALELWIDAFGGEVASQSCLPAHTFTDLSLALAGSRSKEFHVMASLTGGGSGMGSFHHRDVKIVNFGPQHLPLGDCRGFGIESHAERLSQSEIRCSESDGSFQLEGMARVTPRPKPAESNAMFRNGSHSGIWVGAKQTFKGGQLALEMEFCGLHDLSMLAFAFFVKARSCVVDSRQIIRPRSFERYQGGVRPIRFRGEQATVEIGASESGGSMQVIPLGGGDNFWGADFLVAYILEPTRARYDWCISSG